MGNLKVLTINMSIITDVPDEIIMQYLLRLDPQSLQSACRLNRQYAAVCEDEVFWLIKQPGLSDLIYRLGNGELG